MELKKPAIAGTTESSDIQITLMPNPEGGLRFSLKSIVKAQFGGAILATVQATLEEFGVTDAIVQIDDKGAFDWVIKARMQTAICRAAEHHFDWKGVE